MTDFRSDNVLGCSPEVLRAIERAAEGTQTSYGGDEITASLRRRCCELFNADVDVFPVLTGTAGNALALAAMTPPWGAVFCHEDAHIHRDELGATEFFSGGAKLITIKGEGGKLHPADLERSIDEIRNSKKTAVPACVSITNATEAGTVYSPDEMRALFDVARKNGLRVHVDGARWANAVASKKVKTNGIDILTFGATKNGTLNADLIVVFNRNLSEDLSMRMHRSGHRPSKMRFLSAQLEAYLTGDLWLSNARHANAMAAKLRDGIAANAEIVRPVDANIVFVRIPPPMVKSLETAGFRFSDWPIFGPDVYRLVTGFSTDESSIERFISVFTRR
ncbi:MAG TPA: beta-eliminating lyase-related protein [Thermoanaerobaculia bacterium]|nr:beta-eliminating lyase-related protein [Thermoanaerobaculia bacterium]